MGQAWLSYDKSFRMRSAIQPNLQGDEPLPGLWLQSMMPASPNFSDRCDSGHIIRKIALNQNPHAGAGQVVQPPLLCWDYNYNDAWTRKPCRFQHECSVCVGQHPCASCFRVGTQRQSKGSEGGKKTIVEGVILEKGTNPIKVPVLEEWLCDYPIRKDGSYLLEDFRYGFRKLARGERKAFLAQNLKSVFGMEDIAQEKIAKEVREGRVLGPFVVPRMETLRVSPLGIVP